MLLARLDEASITLLHVASPESDPRSRRFFEEFSPALYGLKHITRTVTAKGEISKAIAIEAEDHQALTIGAPSNELQPNSWMQSLLTKILSSEDKTLVLVNEYIPQTTSSTPRSVDLK